jgi:hypothetical protein
MSVVVVLLIKLYHDLESADIITVRQVWYIRISITRESAFSSVPAIETNIIKIKKNRYILLDPI